MGKRDRKIHITIYVPESYDEAARRLAKKKDISKNKVIQQILEDNREFSEELKTNKL